MERTPVKMMTAPGFKKQQLLKVADVHGRRGAEVEQSLEAIKTNKFSEQGSKRSFLDD